MQKSRKNFVTNMGNTWGFLFFLAGFEGILEGKVRRPVHAKKTIGTREALTLLDPTKTIFYANLSSSFFITEIQYLTRY